MELLSPAGNLEKLKIALEYGADAVYGGVSHFSLRTRSSKEFDIDSFKEGVDYTHSMGKKIYVTINGFPFNSQLKLLSTHIENICALNPDAIIVATPGVLKMVKDIDSKMPLHLSTQANVTNVKDAEFYHEIGVERIVAAREASLKDLVEIKKELPSLEIEMFVHGAMCFAYSGRCLISALQSGRISNKGSCANDCRFPYELYAYNEEEKSMFRLEEYEDGTYIMNAKDLNMSSHIQTIAESGAIDSLKIEGRTKSEYYVGLSAKIYKQAIKDAKNSAFNSEFYQKELLSIKHRGYSDGYIINRPYEKNREQNLDSAISDGTHQVCAIVDEGGEFFLCKHKIEIGDSLEIVSPVKKLEEIQEVCNSIGEVVKKDGTFFIKFNKIVTEKDKELQSVHSGNVNKIKLPIKLPKYSFLRKEI